MRAHRPAGGPGGHRPPAHAGRAAGVRGPSLGSPRAAARESTRIQTAATIVPGWDQAVRQALGEGLVAVGMALKGARPLPDAPAGIIRLEAPEREALTLRGASAKLAALLGQPAARVEITVGPGAGYVDERTKRYRAAEQHPIVQDLLKRFDADITTRDLASVEEWLTRFAGTDTDN